MMPQPLPDEKTYLTKLLFNCATCMVIFLSATWFSKKFFEYLPYDLFHLWGLLTATAVIWVSIHRKSLKIPRKDTLAMVTLYCFGLVFLLAMTATLDITALDLFTKVIVLPGFVVLLIYSSVISFKPSIIMHIEYMKHFYLVFTLVSFCFAHAVSIVKV